jgi:RNA polymerase sigma factor (sigma-70 family)
MSFHLNARLHERVFYSLVNKSLAELPTEYREVLVLRELEQLSYREIANIAGIPLGIVMSRISRARQQLQRVLFNLRNAGRADVVLART